MTKGIKELENYKPRYPSSSMVPGFLVVAGSGGGKTRFLEEIYRYYVTKESEKSTVIFTTLGGDGIVPAYSYGLENYDVENNSNDTQKLKTLGIFRKQIILT